MTRSTWRDHDWQLINEGPRLPLQPGIHFIINAYGRSHFMPPRLGSQCHTMTALGLCQRAVGSNHSFKPTPLRGAA